MRVRIPPPALTNMLQPAASFIGRARITISRILCEADAHEWRPRSTGDAPSARLSLGASPLRSRTVGILQRFPERLRPIPSHRDLGARRTRRSCTTPARRSLGFARDDNVPRCLNQYAHRCRRPFRNRANVLGRSDERGPSASLGTTEGVRRGLARTGRRGGGGRRRLWRSGPGACLARLRRFRRPPRSGRAPG